MGLVLVAQPLQPTLAFLLVVPKHPFVPSLKGLLISSKLTRRRESDCFDFCFKFEQKSHGAESWWLERTAFRTKVGLMSDGVATKKEI